MLQKGKAEGTPGLWGSRGALTQQREQVTWYLPTAMSTCALLKGATRFQLRVHCLTETRRTPHSGSRSPNSSRAPCPVRCAATSLVAKPRALRGGALSCLLHPQCLAHSRNFILILNLFGED